MAGIRVLDKREHMSEKFNRMVLEHSAKGTSWEKKDHKWIDRYKKAGKMVYEYGQKVNEKSQFGKNLQQQLQNDWNTLKNTEGVMKDQNNEGNVKWSSQNEAAKKAANHIIKDRHDKNKSYMDLEAAKRSQASAQRVANQSASSKIKTKISSVINKIGNMPVKTITLSYDVSGYKSTDTIVKKLNGRTVHTTSKN